jgi:ABC-type transport system involved in multi-copper enzyme maturation permease subunit
MSVRDLGYRAYDGQRLPASHNTWVMTRHSLRRAWSSWLVKLPVFFCGGTSVVLGIYYLVAGVLVSQQTGEPFDAAPLVRSLVTTQMWLFVPFVALGAGAGAIAQDAVHRAFQFYFAKPVTPAQYLFGRVSAVAFFSALVVVVPGVLLILLMVGYGAPTPEVRLERAGYLLPFLLSTALLSLVMASVSVGFSSLSKSRALTMSSFILVLVVPHVIAGAISLLAKTDWVFLVSLPGLLDVVFDALFKSPREPEDHLLWWHAAPVLAAATGGSLYLAHHRLTRAEVIT